MKTLWEELNSHRPTNDSLEFCYQKHGYPNLVKPNPSVNDSSSDTVDVKNAHSAIDTSSSTGLTQEHYNHLVSLLQQSQLIASGSPPSQPTSNHITSTSSNPSSSIFPNQSLVIFTICPDIIFTIFFTLLITKLT